MSPRCTASHASRAVNGRGLAATSEIRPLFLPTIFSHDGGLGGRSRIRKSTKAWRSRIWSAGLNRRSKPIVEKDKEEIERQRQKQGMKRREEGEVKKEK